MLLDLETLQWDSDLCAAVGVPEAMLPAIVPSVGPIAPCSGVLEGTELAAILGDQHAALVGQAAFDIGDTKVTDVVRGENRRNTILRIHNCRGFRCICFSPIPTATFSSFTASSTSTTSSRIECWRLWTSDETLVRSLCLPAHHCQ